MTNKVAIDDKLGSAFFIMKHDPETEVETYFESFVNEVEGLGTEDECMCYELEKWCEIPERAHRFNTYKEALDWYDVLDPEERNHCSIGLFGFHVGESSTYGSRWFPLKWFLANRGVD